MTVPGARQNTPRLRPPSPRRGFSTRRASEPGALASLGAIWWYDSVNLTSTGQQTVTDRIGGVNPLQSGSTSGVDTNDPTVNLATRNYWSLITDDYLQHPAADTPGAGSFSMLMLYLGTAGLQVFWSTETTTDTGYVLFATGATLTIRARSPQDASVTTTGNVGDGVTVRAVGFVFTSGSPGTVKAYERNAGFGSATNVTVAPTHGTPRIGSRAHSVNLPMNGNVYAAVGFNAALSLTDMNTAADYLLAGVY